MRLPSIGYYVLLGFCLCFRFRGIVGLNIIAIATMGTTSHFIWTNTLITRLVERGHRIIELTVRTTQPHPNRTTFVMEEAMCSSQSIMDLVDSKADAGAGDFLHEIKQHYTQMATEARERLNSTAFKRLKAYLASSEEKIDLILIDHSNRDALISIAHLVGRPPIVAMTAFNQPSTINTVMGNPIISALTPQELTPFSCEMSVTERCMNLIGYIFERLVERYYFEPAVNGLLRETFGEKAPTLLEFESDISISLEMQDFLDGATHGAVIISFGSQVRLELMPRFQEELIAVFGKMKQRFLWKTAAAPRNLPPNVRAYKWLPQSDVLAHPKVVLLVGHGGTLSMQEAVHYGVPAVLIPFFLDQHGNAARIASIGAGTALALPLHLLNAQSLQRKITETLGNPKYKKTMESLSLIARDQPESPLERAVFWTEFVGRNQGGPHFHTGHRRMTWIQIYSIDVLIIFIIGSSLIATGICIAFRIAIAAIPGPGQDYRLVKGKVA